MMTGCQRKPRRRAPSPAGVRGRPLAEWFAMMIKKVGLLPPAFAGVAKTAVGRWVRRYAGWY
jgi:hypothetical protein